MEIKLFVRTHKENFGSVLMFSHNMLPKEKKILEDIKYTTYKPDEAEIIEVSASGFYIYFCTYIGGQDEYGRDYQNVIATIFPFRINESDVLNLRKTFKDIMNNISSSNFSEDNRYFSEIKVKQSYISSTKLKKRNFLRFNLKKLSISLFIFIIILSSAFAGKGYISSLLFSNKNSVVNSFNSDNRNKYNHLMKLISEESDVSQRYILYKDLISSIEKDAIVIKNSEADKNYNEILTESKKTNKDSMKLSILINNYLQNIDFKKHIQEVKNIKSNIEKVNYSISFNDLSSKIDDYNNLPGSDNLNSLIKMCKSNLSTASNDERVAINKILYQANFISNGINSEVEIYISNKSSVFNRRTLGFELKVDSHESQSKTKAMNNNPNIYAGSFFVTLSPMSTINFKIYDYSYDGKKSLLKDASLSFKDLNSSKPVADNNGNSFQIELRIISDKFKIRK